MFTSPRLISSTCLRLNTLYSMFLWFSMTALAALVVPDVKMRLDSTSRLTESASNSLLPEESCSLPFSRSSLKQRYCSSSSMQIYVETAVGVDIGSAASFWSCSARDACLLSKISTLLPLFCMEVLSSVYGRPLSSGTHMPRPHIAARYASCQW